MLKVIECGQTVSLDAQMTQTNFVTVTNNTGNTISIVVTDEELEDLVQLAGQDYAEEEAGHNGDLHVVEEDGAQDPLRYGGYPFDEAQ